MGFVPVPSLLFVSTKCSAPVCSVADCQLVLHRVVWKDFVLFCFDEPFGISFSEWLDASDLFHSFGWSGPHHSASLSMV